LTALTCLTLSPHKSGRLRSAVKWSRPLVGCDFPIRPESGEPAKKESSGRFLKWEISAIITAIMEGPDSDDMDPRQEKKDSPFHPGRKQDHGERFFQNNRHRTFISGEPWHSMFLP
jgi:hypothetical protein